eukprot:Phypoly_transcript_00608.p1 GENE.Phypoly_transcript_00608~~Phypoly_transcript_00608.p1  ORF type:complete len:793 (-),score=73.68 Phypoly_transcript_00608:976-3354(-)
MGSPLCTQCMVWGRGEDGWLPCQIVNSNNHNLSLLGPPVSLKSVDQVACGGKHSIVQTVSGEVYTWGWNWHGQLGHGDMHDQQLAQPVRTLALVRALTGAYVVAVAAGKEHSMALTNTGAVYSWGGGRDGQLGIGEEEASPIPRLITKFHSVHITTLCASGDHSLAIGEGGVVYSWGKGANGRLGHGDEINHSTPAIVKALTGLHVTMIACGWSHSLAVCAKTSDTSVLYTWGKGDSGQLGHGDRLDRLLPTEMCLESDLHPSSEFRTITNFHPGKILAVAAGYFHTGLIVKNTDKSSIVPTRVYTWGWGEHGQLGHGGVEDEVLPRVVVALQTLHVTHMACGGAHSMVTAHNSECYGFGNAEFGQLGFMKEESTASIQLSGHNELNSTNEALGILVGSDKICPLPTQVCIEGYQVLRVACGWWHTVAIVQNYNDIILSPPPPPIFSVLDAGAAVADSLSSPSERESEQTEDDNDFETSSPHRFNLLSKLRTTFGSPTLDIERANNIATEEWNAALATWATSKTSKRTRTLWRCGIPPNMRKEVWTRALGIGPSTQFEELMQSIHANRAARLATGTSSETARLIALDVPRTYPALAMFQKDCSLHQPLHDVLEAVAWSNPTLGYCQGMSYIGSTLLMYMDASMSFTVMCTLTQRPLLSALYAMNVPMVVQHMRIFEQLFSKHLPLVFEHFCNLGITSDQYVLEWIMTLFSRALPLEISHRLWDCFIMEGELFLYRAIVGILKMNKHLFENGTFEQCLALLKTFKEFDANLLFKKIFSVRVPKHLISIADRLG